MTLLPFYGYYFPFERYSECSNRLKTGDGKSLLVSLGLISAVSVSIGTSLRFCRSCALTDLANHGETYWKRAHQLAGTIICTTHNEVLRLSSAKMFSEFRSRQRFQDANSHIDIEKSPACADLNAKEFELATRISVRCLELLYGSPTPWTSFYPYHLYRIAAVSSQSRKDRSSNRVNGDIAKDFIDFFGASFLVKLGCNFRMNSAVLKSMFRSTSTVCSHPLFHVLAQVFLESRVGNPPKFDKALLGERWKCPNSLAKHPSSFRVPTVTPRRQRGKQYWSAKCTCGYGFSFTGPSSDDPSMPAKPRVFAYGPAVEAHAKRLKSSGASVRQIATSMKISRPATVRLISGTRNRYELSKEELKALRNRWTRERCHKAYRKLLRCDRAWLLKQPKTPKPGGRGRVFDWNAFDAHCAPLLAPAADALRSARPRRRISICSLIDQTGIHAFRKKSRKMPLCDGIIAGLVEPAIGWKERVRAELAGSNDRGRFDHGSASESELANR